MSKLLVAISFQKPKKRPLNYNVNTLYPPKPHYSVSVSHEPILTIFGTTITEEVSNKKAPYFPTSPNLHFCIT